MGGISSVMRRIKRAIEEATALLRQINDNVSRVSNELVESIRYVNQQVLPQVNAILHDFQDVVKIAGKFLMNANLAVKVLILFILLCAAFVCKKLSSGKREGILATFEALIVQFIHWQILIFALASVIGLSNDIFSSISLPASNVTFLNATSAAPLNPALIILLPSAVALLLNYKTVLGGLKYLLYLIRFITYVIIGLPLDCITSPVATASAYLKHSCLLASVVCVLYGSLYLFVAYSLFWLFTDVLVSQLPESSVHNSELLPVYRLLLAYAMFYAVSILTYLLDWALKKICIRPLWAYRARRR